MTEAEMVKRLRDILKALQICYCEVGPQMTQDDRAQHRKVLIATNETIAVADAYLARPRGEPVAPFTYFYAYRDPFSGARVWRHKSGQWNGQSPIESLPLYAAPAAPEWVSVEERLPEDGQFVWVASPNDLRLVVYHADEIEFADVPGATHWMPLHSPAPPTTKEKP